MTINVKNKQYQDVFEYLKKEEPDFYRELKKGYFFKNSAFPEMTKQHYLIFVSQKTKGRIRAILERIDESLVSDEEIANLEKIINSSRKLKKIVEDYTKIRKTSSRYLTKTEQQKLDGKAAQKVYENISGSDRRKYSREKVTIIMPKLNLGPWKQNTGNGNNDNNKSIDGLIVRMRDFFDAEDEAFITGICERYFEHSQKLQSTKSISEAREVLDKLT